MKVSVIKCISEMGWDAYAITMKPEDEFTGIISLRWLIIFLYFFVVLKALFVATLLLTPSHLLYEYFHAIWFELFVISVIVLPLSLA